MQRLVRGYIGRQRAFDLRLARNVYATRIQAVGRSFLLRLQLRNELAELLATVAEEENLVGELEPHLLLMSADERIQDDAARKIQAAWVPRHNARRRGWAAELIQRQFRRLRMRHDALERFLALRGMHDLYAVRWARPLLSRAVAKAARLARDKEVHHSVHASENGVHALFEPTSIIADKMPQYFITPSDASRSRGEHAPLFDTRSDAVLRRSARSFTYLYQRLAFAHAIY